MKSNAALDEMDDYLKALQEKTGVKLLWSTQNLFSDPRYMNGGFTNPDNRVFFYACAQVKKVLDVNHKLGGENLVFWGGREGYQSVLNTDVRILHIYVYIYMNGCFLCSVVFPFTLDHVDVIISFLTTLYPYNHCR